MKKRFELFEEELKYWIHDYGTRKNYGEFDLCFLSDLLNEQDEKIKELENMNSRLSQGIYWGNGEQFCDVVKRLKQENQQLKQSQNSKAIEVLEQVKEYCENWKQYAVYYNYVLVEETSGVRTMQTLYDFINNQISELRKKRLE